LRATSWYSKLQHTNAGNWIPYKII